MWGSRVDVQIVAVSDDELPTDWAFAETPHKVFCFVRESAFTPETLTEAWRVYRHMACRSLGVVPTRGPSVPEPRGASAPVRVAV